MPSSFSEQDLQAHIPRLRRYARALTGSREAADDLTQDTLERAWNKRMLWQTDTNLRAWLFTVMHNVFVNGVKRARPADSLDAMLESSSDPEAANVSAETGVALHELKRALLQLPDEQREVVLLVGLEQLSYAEAAQALAVPIGTVMSRLSRGRDRLRVLLEHGASAAPLQQVIRRVK